MWELIDHYQDEQTVVNISAWLVEQWQNQYYTHRLLCTSGEPKPKTICGQFGGRDEPAAAASDGFINGLFVGCLHTYLYILYSLLLPLYMYTNWCYYYR